MNYKQTLAVYTISLLCLGGLLGSSCKTQTVTDTVYLSSKGAHITATTALKAWNDFLASHNVSIEQELQVKAAYEKYQIAQVGLLDATIALNKAPSSNTTNSVEISITQTSAALTELLNLLTKFGVKF